jgi:osmoprotectant transport system substrate-binding protein
MRARSLLLALLLPLLAVAGCSAGQVDTSSAGARVTIVGQNFTEADVVSQLYRALLDAAGFRATVRSLGGRDLYLGPLEKGSVQVAADSLSATADAINHRATGDDASVSIASSDVAAAVAQLQRVGADAGLTALTPTRAEIKSGYAVTRAFATSNHLATLTDLGRLGQAVALAASPDCAQRPDCAPGLQRVYRIRIAEVEPLGSGTEDTRTALLQGQVQLAQVATTDAQVGAGMVLLADDQHLLDAENITPLVNSAWLGHHAGAREALEKLSGVLTTDDLRTMTARVNAGHTTARSVARAYLTQKGLV